MAIEALDLLKIAASSSVCSASLGWALNYFFVHRSSLQRDATYAALRISLVLERFAIECAAAISSSDMYVQSRGGQGEELTAMPEMATFPQDVDWKPVPISLSDRALTMEVQLAEAKRAVVFAWEIGDDEDARTELVKRAALAGLEAWSIASALRKHYRILDGRVDHPWDVEGLLQDRSKPTCRSAP